MKPTVKSHQFEVLLASAIVEGYKKNDADALHSLIESKASAEESFVKAVERAYPKVAAILAPEERDWFRVQLGGEKVLRQDFAVSCTRLISILEIANLLGFPYLEFRDFLLRNNYKVYAMKKGDRVVAEGTPFATIAVACLDFVVCEKYLFR